MPIFKGNYVKTLLNKLGKQPESVLFSHVANELRQMGQLHQALEIAQRGATRNPAYVNGWFILGLIYIDLDQKPDAIQALSKTIQLDSDHIRAYEKLASIAIKLQKWQEAQHYLNSIMDRRHNHSQSKHLLSEVRKKVITQNDLSQKKVWLEAAELTDPSPKEKLRLKIVQNIRKYLVNDSNPRKMRPS